MSMPKAPVMLLLLLATLFMAFYSASGKTLYFISIFLFVPSALKCYVEGFKGHTGVRVQECGPGAKGCVAGQNCKSFNSNSSKFKAFQVVVKLKQIIS
jgi:hypothetical protein